MPYSITNEGDYLLVKPSGVVVVGDIEHYAAELEALEDSLPRALDRVTDLTAVERFEVGYLAVNGLAVRRRIRKLANPVKSAIIAREPIQIGLARMFQSLIDNPQIDVRIVRTLSEAREWFATPALAYHAMVPQS